VRCRGTPGNLTALGVLLLAVAAGIVTVIPDDNTGLVAAQVALAAALGGGGLAAVLGGNFIAELQKD
jgi:hypothetical protein